MFFSFLVFIWDTGKILYTCGYLFLWHWNRNATSDCPFEPNIQFFKKCFTNGHLIRWLLKGRWSGRTMAAASYKTNRGFGNDPTEILDIFLFATKYTNKASRRTNAIGICIKIADFQRLWSMFELFWCISSYKNYLSVSRASLECRFLGDRYYNYTLSRCNKPKWT